MDEPVSRDNNNPTPGGEVKGGEDLLSMSGTLRSKNLPNNSSLLLGKSSGQYKQNSQMYLLKGTNVKKVYINLKQDPYFDSVTSIMICKKTIK